MPKYIVERKVPGVGHSSQDQLQKMSKISNEALNSLDGQVQWLESFVTDDATYCIYVAPSEELVKRHADLAGFPADRILKIDRIIDPSTGDSPEMPFMTNRDKGMEKPLTQ
jgi:hypothetical protein